MELPAVFSPPQHYLTILSISQSHRFNAGHGQQAAGLFLLLASTNIFVYIYTFLKCTLGLALVKVPLQNFSLQ